MTSQTIVAPATSQTLANVGKPVSISNQEVPLFWENVSFCSLIKGAVPTLPQGSNNASTPVSTDRLGGPDAIPNVQPLPAEMGPPPETIEGRPVKPVVWNLTGSVKPREFVGFLGPSGAGKTVLLNILSDRLNVPVGSYYRRNVFVGNKVPLTRELFGKLCSYVMQDDVLMETMTPYECFSFSANLRLSCSQEEKDRHVMETIALLKLQSCMNTLVPLRSLNAA
ncbi:MAG: ATP-binding cassette domain-containing protein [Candidatus Pacebacteria bacterium]|nr:ATP-binding cassette domain-containing protein [Candidatus Paceibacterota bacterium]